jgi:hypothetical protein
VKNYVGLGIVVLSLACAPRVASAGQPECAPAETEQQSTIPAEPQPANPQEISPQPASQTAAPATGKVGDRIFGMLPNYTTVEGATEIRPPTVKQKFRMAGENSFDPYVFAIVGIDAAIGAGQGGVGYERRYMMALADNSIGNFMTTAVLPSALGQDPRYFQLGEGGVLHRMAYALSRSVVTRGASGARQFNLSEIGGNALAAGVSNLYYPAAARTLGSTVTRWGTQIMWDALSNELKEFWPDIRKKIRKN